MLHTVRAWATSERAMTFRGRLVIAAPWRWPSPCCWRPAARSTSRATPSSTPSTGSWRTPPSPSSGPNANPVIDGPQAYGDGLQIADASGSVVAAPATSPCRHRPGPRRRAAPCPFFTSVTSAMTVREYVSTIPPFTIRAENSPPVLVQTSAALQLTTQLAATNDQLHKLGIACSVALGGGARRHLGWIVGRTALIPLNDLTDAVEQVPRPPTSRAGSIPVATTSSAASGGPSTPPRRSRGLRDASDNWCSTPARAAHPSPACGRTWKSSAGRRTRAGRPEVLVTDVVTQWAS